jgi:hypothetical protein
MIECEVCGMSYVPEVPGDLATHRRVHAEFVSVIEPKPDQRFIRLMARSKQGELVNYKSPKWLHFELFKRAKHFKRELSFDFTQWSHDGSEDVDAIGFVFNDDTGTFGHGAIVGGCAFRWTEFRNSDPGWALHWIWIAPAVRRKGITERKWPTLVHRFKSFRVIGPVSDSMSAFLEKHDHLQAGVR